MPVRMLLVLPMLLLCYSCSTTPADSKAQVRSYPLHGEILRLDPEGRIATIKHEKIGDWMGAMTMEFPIKDVQEFAALREGERIDGTVFVQDLAYWVSGIKEVQSPAGK